MFPMMSSLFHLPRAGFIFSNDSQVWAMGKDWRTKTMSIELRGWELFIDFLTCVEIIQVVVGGLKINSTRVWLHAHKINESFKLKSFS